VTVLADVLDVAGRPERISAPGEELFVTVKLNCGGAVQRVVKSGKVPVPFTGYRVRAGQFIYSRIDARNGAFAIVPEELHGAVVSKDFPVFDVRREQIDERYLVHFLRAGRLQEKIRAASFGATNRQRITEEHLLGFEIFLPPLDEQRRIAAILDQADAIRTKRRQTLAHLDDLTKSIFQARVGDPRTNRYGFRIARIGDVSMVVTGNSPSRLDSDNFGSQIEWIKSSNIGGHVASRAEECLSEKGMSHARMVNRGSVLVTCIAGSPESIGKCSIVDRDVAFNQQINAVVPGEEVLALFLLQQLKNFPGIVREKSTGGMKGLVNKSAFESIGILVPQIEVQESVVNRLSVVWSEQAAVQRALAADDELFASLQSRAFRGEL